MFASEDVGFSADIVVTGEYERFYATTFRRSLAVARALTRNWSDAEDLTQDAYADAHRRWSQLRCYDDPSGWVRRAIVNRSASRWRRLGREARALARLGTATEVFASEQPADVEFWAAVAQLPNRQRRVVALYYVADLAVADIATTLDCSTGTVKTHLSRARTTLHERLQAGHEEATDGH